MKKTLTPFIDAYISNWDYINELEIYKWIAVRHFQDNFFNEEVPFGDRIRESFSKHKNLLDTRRYLPLKLLTEVYEKKPSYTKKMIEALFNESDSLKDRVGKYIASFKTAMMQMADEGYKDWKGRKNLSSYQNTHAISVYLAMRYPNNYYIYKWGVFRDFSNRVGYEIKSKNHIDKYLEFNKLCEEVKKVLLNEKGFISFYDGWLKAHDFKDDNYDLLTQDFIYAVATYLNPSEDKKGGKKKPTGFSVQEIEACEFQSADIKTGKKVTKNVDYARKDKLFRSLGLLGEKWAIAYEKERLRKLGIDFKIIHTSVEEGDGKGYDIESVEDDGKTPRYIEVKTTTGDVTQPFYYSDNELRCSEQQKEHYYVYRIFNFKDEAKPANLLIIHGSLKDLKGKPVNYKVSVKK